MPQLTKGGKYVFGVSVIGQDGDIVIPPEALKEYGYSEGDKVILMSGSRTSGGFVITAKRIIGKTALNSIIEKTPGG